MKKFKIIIFGLLFVLFGATLFWSCSDEELTQSDTKSNFRTFSNEELVDLEQVVNEFYGTATVFRTGVTATVREEVAHYDCTEIIIDSDTRARGYLVSDHTTGRFLHFADVDRTNYVFKTQNLITNERETITDIDHLPDYGSSDEFDVIRIIGGAVGVQPMGWFWGKWNCTEHPAVFITVPATETYPGDIKCKNTCELRRFGISFGTTETWVTCSWTY